MAELMEIMKRSELEVERRLVDPLRQFLWRFSRVCPPAGPPCHPFWRLTPCTSPSASSFGCALPLALLLAPEMPFAIVCSPIFARSIQLSNHGASIWQTERMAATGLNCNAGATAGRAAGGSLLCPLPGHHADAVR